MVMWKCHLTFVSFGFWLQYIELLTKRITKPLSTNIYIASKIFRQQVLQDEQNILAGLGSSSIHTGAFQP